MKQSKKKNIRQKSTSKERKKTSSNAETNSSISDMKINATPTRQNDDMVEALYITEHGSSFEFTAPWPHQNLVALKWIDEEDDETIIEFVYFGSYKNRLIYHAVDEKNSHPS